MRIIQIVPRLPPAVDGVGDYAYTLARNLASRHGVQTVFVACDPANAEAASAGGEGQFQVNVLPRPGTRLLVETVRSLGADEPLLLHYVSYGYARKGCPIWLDRALHLLCAGNRARRLVTMFHELYARGRFPGSAFWLQPVQMALARRLARLSRGSLTSLEGYARILGSWLPGRDLPASLPIPSGVGDGAEPRLEWGRRKREMAVFGQSGTRARAYREFAPELARCCRELGIERIVDIGPPFAPEMPGAIGGVPVESRGPLEPAAVSALLARSMAGFLAYDLPYLGRSSVFAAYCAHGAVPVCVHLDRAAWAAGAVRCQDGLRPGIEFWEPSAAPPLAAGTAQAMAAAARAWYEPHNQAAHADRLWELLQGEA